MAKQTILTERGTGEVMYPQTLASLVQTADGGNVDDGLEKAKFKLFIDQWNTACGKYGTYNEDTGYFELNGLTDITYEEALYIYQISAGWNSARNDSAYAKYIPNNNFIGIKARTIIPAIKGSPWTTIFNLFQSSELEIIRVVQSDDGVIPSNMEGAFSECRKLRKILSPLHYASASYAFSNCINLEEVKLAIDGNINLKDSPKLKIDCFQFMAAKSGKLKGAIVTVHPDVFAKLNGDTSNEAAAALTPEELVQWQQVLTDAAEKNITFAST